MTHPREAPPAPFLIPSIDLLAGRAVRLLRGSFDHVTEYGDPLEILDRWRLPDRTLVHVVDLEGSRSGTASQHALVRRIADRGFRLQAGGGVRDVDDALRWLDAGAVRVVVGTAAADHPDRLRAICRAVGAARVVVAMDLREGEVRTSGWERKGLRPAEEVRRLAEELGVAALLVTDIGSDGTLGGPSFDLYRRLLGRSDVPVLASGGIGTAADVVALARIGVAGAVAGRALLEGRLHFDAAEAEVAMASRPVRVIPCLDVRGGRVVKGVAFRGLRDAGDPAACARRYEREGADELVLLDVAATAEARAASLETVRTVARSLFIPLTVGGGVRSLEEFRSILRAGADRVAINSAAVREPELIRRAASEFGAQAVVLACDVRREGDRDLVVTHSGTATTSLEASEWCARAAELGAGEILLTSIDRDGTQSGFDLDLIRRVRRSVPVGVIASGGAGCPGDFADAVERGGAAAVLAASTFHDGRLGIADVKRELALRGIATRTPSVSRESGR